MEISFTKIERNEAHKYARHESISMIFNTIKESEKSKIEEKGKTMENV